ncbi:hypothetical protein TKK_0011996 [Trichogramma kaykai]|uniref:VWFA domain-containing protein n=1 Tax=Trichogramma kaykai TaxID=54128 RepID=A0ABD2WPK0_9HYME
MRALTGSWFLPLVLLCLCTCQLRAERRSKESVLVDQWAESIGQEIWRLTNTVLQPTELLQRYKKMGARVADKSGEEIIKTIGENVGRMLSRKMDAVKCLYKEAESLSEQWNGNYSNDFTYYSAKYSNASVEQEIDIPQVPSNMLNQLDTYVPMSLEPDTHFNNISVNTSFSSIHVPTNVFDKLPRVGETILWSKQMDRIFKHNYRSDPALMWQYLCSTTGILRQYPAMRWPVAHTADGRELSDTYDCRVRSWFIEASTCSKDMVVLVDNSGSMTGMSNTIAKATVATILSTLSNNDFVAVFNFSDTTDQIVPCFQDKLVQATPENIKKFNLEIDQMRPEGVANLTEAFMTAFDILEAYRTKERCGEGMSCNQMIMLITDGIASNITEVFEAYNWFENGTRIPVRVFTYLLGQEVQKVREIQWMACLNRGYYAHIHNQAEVPEQVLKYINVVARPLVLYGKAHPVVWTHAYVDISREQNTSPISKDPKFVDDGVDITDEKDAIEAVTARKKTEGKWGDRLLISVSIPVFDRRGNAKNPKKQADLLGVVGTDVPLKDIRKLTLPYKLGVNGYAFIVSNNGYVVLHPALKPDYNGELKLNYNSIDLTEVEILDDGKPPREPGEEITEIRRALVNHECGSKKSVRVKLHYDDYRRVTLESRDYFYAKLPLTPFGIAVVLPQYGRYYIKVNKKIEKYRNINISDYFVGDDWGVHPEWVYCRYHYLEGHEFETPEDELRHFLAIIGDFSKSEAERYPEQYKPYTKAKVQTCANLDDAPVLIEDDDDEDLDCGSDDLEEELEDFDRHRNDHYCNKELVELLLMDAYATHELYSGEFRSPYSSERELMSRYEVFQRFVSTQSGLTRWQGIENAQVDSMEERIARFRAHRRGPNEPWYKGAILQNEVDPDSVSVTVPPIKEPESGLNATVTISMGVYPRDAGKRAAAGVTGFLLPMTALYKQFMSIVTDKVPIPSLNCNSSTVDCYLIDQNGYIVISEAHNHDAGKFFGTLDETAPVFRSLVEQGLFDAVDIYDYLAVCYDIKLESGASTITNPFEAVWDFIKRPLTTAMAPLQRMSSAFNLPLAYAQDMDKEPDFTKPPKKHKVRYSRPCDMKMTLYIVNSTNYHKSFTNREDDCALQFYAQRVPHTNLIFVIVKTDQQSCYDKMDVSPHEIFPYTVNGNITEFPCHKIPLNNLYRRRLEHCHTQHEDEDLIEACGGAANLEISYIFLVIFILANVALHLRYRQ